MGAFVTGNPLTAATLQQGVEQSIKILMQQKELTEGEDRLLLLLSEVGEILDEEKEAQ